MILQMLQIYFTKEFTTKVGDITYIFQFELSFELACIPSRSGEEAVKKSEICSVTTVDACAQASRPGTCCVVRSVSKRPLGLTSVLLT